MTSRQHQQWEYIWSRPACMQDFESLVLRSGNVLSEGKVPVIMIPHEGKWEAWHPQPQFNQFMESLGRHILDSSWNTKKHVKLFVKVARDMRNKARVLGSVPKRAPASEWLRRYVKFQNGFSAYSVFIWQPWSITYFVEEWMVARLQKHFENWQELYDIIARAPKPYQTQRMVEAVWHWKISKGTQATLDKIVRRFRHLGIYSVNHPLWTVHDVLQQAGSFHKSGEKLSKALAERRKTQRLFRKVYRDIKKKDPMLARVAEAVHAYVWLRTERIDAYKQFISLTQSFYRKLEQRMGYEKGWGAHLTVKEIESLLRGKASVTREELRRRHGSGYIGYVHKGGSEIISDPKEQKRFLKLMIGDQKKKGNMVKGNVACTGMVRGKVKVLFHAQETSKFPKGAILVANMTHPDYMPAIRNASAIVTDEGGIVCHAAVISREMKIPCVIGTKIATKVFRDGDQVEVDAERGIVRRL